MKNFNKLTPAETERLAILAEECSEVIKVVGKILRHGFDSCDPVSGLTNRQLLEIELGDIDVAEQMLLLNDDINLEAIFLAYHKKREKIEKYLHHNEAP